jgi:hypothetical protein
MRIFIHLILFMAMCGCSAQANDFYTATGSPAANSALSSATIRNEFALIEDGFDKQPSLTGNGDKPIFVNSAGSAEEAITASSARTKLGLEIGTDIPAYDANLPTWPATVDATEVGYLNGVTSAIQTQLDGKASLATAAASTNTNLLINSNFVVNQEGYTSGVITTGEYGHDMWKSISSASYTLSGSALTLVSGTLGQRNDDMIAADGVTVTLSVTSGSLTIGATAGASSTVVTPASPYTWTLDMSGSAFVTFTAATGADGIKLERGSAQTAYIIPEPRAEEARCYYYYRPIYIAGISMVNSGGSGSLAVLPFTMRTGVTFAGTYTFAEVDNTGVATPTPSVSILNGLVQLIVTHSSYLGPFSLFKLDGELDARY